MPTALILVRIDSKRLPGKALKKIGDFTIIEWVINRVKRSRLFQPLILTTERTIDDLLVDIALKHNIEYYRGDLAVADRVYKCLIELNIETFARVNGDSPFVDWKLLDRGYELLRNQRVDFVTNLFPRSYPYGISVEILKSSLFLQQFHHIQSNSKYQEHITSYFYDNIDFVNYATLPVLTRNLSDFHLTVDTQKDLQEIKILYKRNPEIFGLGYQDILKSLISNNP